MFYHIELEWKKLKSLIENREIVSGGNKRLKIYGTLSCKSGKRMKKENRVFFSSEKEAIKKGYRPCAHCMKTEYQKWKEGQLNTVSIFRNLIIARHQSPYQ